MCVGFPGQVTAVDDLGATVRTLDRERRASTILMPDIVVGDWVYVTAGTIVERLDPNEAAEIRKVMLATVELEEAEDRSSPGPESVNEPFEVTQLPSA